MNIQPKARSESTGHKGSKRTSPSHQIYLLSGHAKRVATALRNVFKSDTKEESSKSKEQGHSHGKYLSVDPMRTSLETVSVEMPVSRVCLFFILGVVSDPLKTRRYMQIFCQIPLVLKSRFLSIFASRTLEFFLQNCLRILIFLQG